MVNRVSVQDVTPHSGELSIALPTHIDLQVNIGLDNVCTEMF